MLESTCTFITKEIETMFPFFLQRHQRKSENHQTKSTSLLVDPTPTSPLHTLYFRLRRLVRWIDKIDK